MKKFLMSIFIFFALYEVAGLALGTPLDVLAQRFMVGLLDSDNLYPCMAGGWMHPFNQQAVNLYSPAQSNILLAKLQGDLPRCKQIMRADQILSNQYLASSDQAEMAQALINQQQLKAALANAQNNTDLTWASPNNNQLPANIFVAATNAQDNLYVCQATFNGNLYPGQYSAQGCILTYAGTATVVNTYTLLVLMKPATWIDSAAWNANALSAVVAIPGGTEDYHDVAICKTSFEGATHLGKIAGTSCDIAVDQKEVSVSQFEFLAYQP